MPRKAADLESTFLGKMQGKQDNGDHRRYYFYYQGRAVLHTKLSHGHREVPDNILGVMARQLSVSKKQLGELCDCTMSAQQWEAHVAQVGQAHVRQI